MKGKKIACVVPPFYRLIESKNNRMIPSMHYLTEILHNRGHEVMFVNGDYVDESEDYSDRLSMTLNNWLFEERYRDGHKAFDEILEIIGEFRPDFVVISAGDILIPTVEVGSSRSCAFLADKIKECYGTEIVCIGYGFTLKYAKKELLKSLDAIIVGEGEAQIVEIIEQNLRGLLPAKLYNQMDELPLLTDKYIYHQPASEDWDYIMSARGCFHRCTFCLQPSLRRGTVSQMSPKRFVDELRYRIRNYNLTGFYFLDMIFLPDSSNRTYEMLDELIQLKQEFPEFNWWAEARADICKVWNDDIADKVKDSGCRHLKFGVEMTDDSMLKTVQKGIKYEQIKKSFEMVQDRGIQTTSYVLLGCPGFDDQDYKRMWQSFKALKADNYVININVPYLGTKLYEQTKDSLNRFRLFKEGEEDFTHTSLIMKKFWDISDETLELFFSLQGKKDDSIIRAYKSKIVDKDFYDKHKEIKFISG